MQKDTKLIKDMEINGHKMIHVKEVNIFLTNTVCHRVKMSVSW